METPSLGAWAFQGSVTPADRRGTSLVGQAHFDGVIGWAPWPQERARRLLPADLELAPATAGPSDGHPVLVALGRHRDSAVVYGGVRFDVGVAYDECMLSVPFVRRRGGRQLHTFVAFMVSGDRRATWSGNTHYGFAKRMGCVDRVGDVWTARPALGGPVIHGASHPMESWRRGADSMPPVARSIPRVFDAPVLGRRKDGSYVASYFVWDLAEALVRPTRLRCFITNGEEDGADAAEVTTDEALEVQGMRWGLGWPELPVF